MLRITSLLMMFVILFTVAGCGKSKLKKRKKEKKKENTAIFKKTTQDIGKYDPNAGLELQDSKIKITNLVTGPLEAYGPGMQRSSELGITHAIDLYHAEHGRYPTYEQFMSEIIKPPPPRGQMNLPVLPYKAKYMYDEANHKLVVVKNPDAKKEEQKKK